MQSICEDKIVLRVSSVLNLKINKNKGPEELEDYRLWQESTNQLQLYITLDKLLLFQKLFYYMNAVEFLQKCSLINPGML